MKHKKIVIWSLIGMTILLVGISVVVLNNQTLAEAPDFSDFENMTPPSDMDMSNFDPSKMTNRASARSSISATAEVKSGLTEQLELHATYYLEDTYVEEGQTVKKGENLLKYTNGEYLTAPYDGVVVSLAVPAVNGQCTNSHYVEFSATNVLEVQFRVDESKISSISLGDEATINIDAISKSEIAGVVTSISNTASSGKFTVTVEFENVDDVIMLGMTAKIKI